MRLRCKTRVLPGQLRGKFEHFELCTCLLNCADCSSAQATVAGPLCTTAQLIVTCGTCFQRTVLHLLLRPLPVAHCYSTADEVQAPNRFRSPQIVGRPVKAVCTTNAAQTEAVVSVFAHQHVLRRWVQQRVC